MAALLSSIFGLSSQAAEVGYDDQKYSNARLRTIINRYTYPDIQYIQQEQYLDQSAPLIMQESELVRNVEAVESSENYPKHLKPARGGMVKLVDPNDPNAMDHFSNSVRHQKLHHMEPEPEYIMERNAKNTISCPAELHPENTMGCWMFPNSEVPFERRQIDTLFTPPGAKPNPIYVRDTQYDPWGSSMTAKWSKYNKENYSRPVLDSDRRKSTGVMINAYTGKMYETFEDDIPPPNTDKEIPREQFEHTNPKLIGLQGGIDLNRYPRSKKEVCQTIPRKDDGPNPWGDQLYADRRRQEMETRAARDIWQNRNGEYSVEPIDDRKPVGFVGYVNAVRPLPYLPATQRNQTDNHGWMGVPEDEHKQGPAWETLLPRVTTTRPDLSECVRIQAPDATNQAVSDHVVMVGGINMKGTNRESTSQFTRQGPIDPGSDGYDRSEMLDPDSLRATLKAAMESPFEITNINGTSQNTGYLPVVDTNVRPTLKGLMAGQFPVTTTGGEAQRTGYLPVVDTDVRPTQKGIMAEQFPTTTVGGGSEHTGYMPVIDTYARPTLKGLMAGQFPTTTVGGGSQYTGYVPVIDTDVRPTLKGLMAGQFPTTTVGGGSQYTGYVPVIDTDVRPTLKGLMAGQFPTTTVGGGSQYTGYIPVIDTDIRPTQKGLMQTQFNPGNAGNNSTGNVIEFQGDVKGTKRQVFEAVERTPFIGIETWGTQVQQQSMATKVDPSRGTTAINWFPVSRVPVEGGDDTNSRWIGYHSRATERQQQHRPPLSDRATLQEPMVLPTLSSNSCRSNTEANLDEDMIRWLPPTYYTEATIGGR